MADYRSETGNMQNNIKAAFFHVTGSKQAIKK